MKQEGGMTRQQFKRRLVGAIVLASLAVIFLPMLLDNRVADEQLGTVIPQRDVGAFNEELAQTEIQPIAKAAQPVTAAAEPSPAAVPEANSLPATAAGSPAKSPAAVPALSAWVVQVGSYAKPDNAKGVAAKLRAAGFDTVVDKVTLDGQILYRVQVGPEIEKAKAEQLRKHIREKLQLDGTVRPHQAG
jgi:DedD protein